MSSPYPVLGDRPINQWRVTELKDELKRRKLITKGLKEDLIKRLDEAIRNEQVSQNEDNGFNSVLQPHTSSVHEISEGCNPSNEKVSRNVIDFDMNESHEPIDAEVRKGEGLDGSDAAWSPENSATQVTAGENNDLMSENPESAVAPKGEVSLDIGSQNMIPDGKTQLEDENSKSLPSDAKIDVSDTNTLVSEVNPVIGFQVKYESIITETHLITEKNELKDDVIADDVKLEKDAKPEIIQPLFNSDIPKSGKPHTVGVEEPHDEMVLMEETGGNNNEGLDDGPKMDNGDLNFSVKVKLDQSSGDNLMNENVTATKPMSTKIVSEERTDQVKAEESAPKDEGLVDIVGEDISDEKKLSIVEEKEHPLTPSVKRKPNVGITDVAKRQRRWKSDGPKAAEARTDDVVLTSPKNSFQPAFSRSFSRSDSSVSVEVPKERVVPPPTNPPTNSLRIENFLRPFTLKAVQEFLGKTGTITNFWMDQIKTHCYVSYSSVEEASETRNAVFNLQWPPNGGRLLAAEFVDPQDVKARLEPPPQSSAAQPNSGSSTFPVTRSAQPQPSPRSQVPKQQLQPPPPPPPPTLSNPPPVREQGRPPVREHHQPIKERLTLPPPPPLAEKAEMPVVTLDDLFKKTRATPRIYYLPLSEEQVAVKLQAQGKTVVKQ